jgi:hypothetical protein
MLKGLFSPEAQRRPEAQHSPAPRISLEGHSPAQPNLEGHRNPVPFINPARCRSPVLRISLALPISPAPPISPARPTSLASVGRIGLAGYRSPGQLIREGQRSPEQLSSPASAGFISLEGCLSLARHLNPALVNYTRYFQQVGPGT